jgi:hypothetical protein
MTTESKLNATNGKEPSSVETTEKKDTPSSKQSPTPTKKSAGFAPKDMTGSSGGFVITGVDGLKKK